MRVDSVTVFPSDFGLEKMAEEALHGPPRELWNQANTRASAAHSDDDSSDESTSNKHSKQSQEQKKKTTRYSDSEPSTD